jgi:hypothetical protein
VCGGEDVDVLPQGLRKASLLQPVDVVATLVGPRHTHAVKALIVREGLQHLSVQGIHVVCGDGPFPGPAKEVSELGVVSLPHLLVEDNDVSEALPDQLAKGGSRSLRRLPERLGLDGGELVKVSYEDDDRENC